MAGCVTSAAPVLFAGLESTADAFFGRPRPQDPLLTFWLDSFNPIGVAERDNPVGLHEVDIAMIPSGAQRLPKVRPRGIRGCRLVEHGAPRERCWEPRPRLHARRQRITERPRIARNRPQQKPEALGRRLLEIVVYYKCCRIGVMSHFDLVCQFRLQGANTRS
jgi:hypothetical protein